MIMGEKEHIQEADNRLYTRDLVIQDCNSYIKQVGHGTIKEFL